MSQNLKIKLSKLTQREKAVLNLTQSCIEVGFMAEAAAVAAENIGHTKSVALEYLKKTKPVAVAAELAARLSKQPRTAAAADCKVFK